MNLFVACLLFVLGWFCYTLVEARKLGKQFRYWPTYIRENALDHLLTAIGGIIVMLFWKYTGITIPLPESLGGSLVLVQGQYTASAALLGFLSIVIIDKVTMLLGVK